eukprot:m.15554 g.15554  ORF g.15554 m.15554 type:complete len:144 (+) comp26428_c1_seq1:421-852(+)
MKLSRYASASIVGLLPTQALNTYMGTTFRSMEDVIDDKMNGYLLLLLQVAISILLMVYVIRRARRELNRACQQQEDIESGHRIVTVEPNFLRIMSHHSLGNLNGNIDNHDLTDPYGTLKAKQMGHQRSMSASAALAQLPVSYN